MEDLLVSVLIITYNQEKYIKETLDSVINQKHDYSYEIIIGEDCSTDGTRFIINDYALKYPEIIKPIFNVNNLGLIRNYYNTLDHCKGKYIMVCGGDDCWCDGKVQQQITYLENHPDYDFLYGKVEGMDSDGNPRKINWGSEISNLNDIFENIDKIPPVTICFKKSIMEKYISEIDPINKNWLMEDYPFYIWCARNTNMKFQSEVYAKYRILENSVSHSPQINKKIRFYESIKNVREFYIDYYHLSEEYCRYTNDFHNRSLFHFYINDLSYDKGIESYKRIVNKTKKDKIIYILIKFRVYSFIRKILKK